MPTAKRLSLGNSLTLSGQDAFDPTIPTIPGIPRKSNLLYADYGDRFYGWMVDQIISFVLSFSTSAVLSTLVINLFAWSKIRLYRISPIWPWVFLLALVISFLLTSWLYFALQESGIKQATPGKRLVGIRVTDLSGNRISFARASARYFAKFPSFFLLLLGYWIQPFTGRKQALHDVLAGTLVILTPRKAPPDEAQGCNT